MQSFVISNSFLSDIHFRIDSNNLQIIQGCDELNIDLDCVSRFFDALEHETFDEIETQDAVGYEFCYLKTFIEIRDNFNPKGFQLITISKSSLNELAGNISDLGL